MPTDDDRQPQPRPRPQTWMEMLADRLDPPGEPEAQGPPAPNSKADEPRQGDVTP